MVKAIRMETIEPLECIDALDDHRFDMMYPPGIREISRVHWTPVGIAHKAAIFLVRSAGTRVLDIGCGPGKFCIVGALTTTGHFTGVEQRKHLCEIARAKIVKAKVSNAEILNKNITDVSFGDFDAFYLFNPFEENLETILKIDASVRFAVELYEEYIEYVARQLAMAPIGTRLVTYCGQCEEVPMGYECVESSFDSNLKFWEKTKNYPVNASLLKARPSSKMWRVFRNLAT